MELSRSLHTLSSYTTQPDMTIAVPNRTSGRSTLERVLANNPPVLESLIDQLPTDSILSLYHTSFFLQTFLQHSPTSWRYVSWRLHQPAPQTATPPNNAVASGQRQSSNYALDQLLIYVLNPYSTRLVSLELDNTAVSGATLFQTVMVLRKDTLEHVSVRGCKNVSLKYHINPWLTMHAMAMDRPIDLRPPGFQKLALKSLYTYRCRHHRRRPYLPSSLARKESDSEPTHELVLTCHKLGIWTDTAWCTTPGARCYRRRGYVTMRVPQDPREVWVVYDRLWRSRNWFGAPPDDPNANTNAGANGAFEAGANIAAKGRQRGQGRSRDERVWEFEEEAVNGEPIGVNGEGKAVPAHLRHTHTRFVNDIFCENCSDRVLERCEQCSVMMHCSGCRKTLCASCAFDRPYLRNKNAPAEDKNKFWWAPGYAVSPCSMQDSDVVLGQGPAGQVVQQANALPTIKFRWCCTEPIFSGGGGITFGVGQNRETDRIRAAPLQPGQGYEDSEFSTHDDGEGNGCCIGAPLVRSDAYGLGGRWASLADLFQLGPDFSSDAEQTVPRILCDDCHGSEQWKIKCKACSMALCLKHDVKERLRVRICGYKDLAQEKQELYERLRNMRVLTSLVLRRRKLRELQAAAPPDGALPPNHLPLLPPRRTSPSEGESEDHYTAEIDRLEEQIASQRWWLKACLGLSPPPSEPPPELQLRANESSSASSAGRTPAQQLFAFVSEPFVRPRSAGSNSTGPSSRTSSPAPSARSVPVTPETNVNASDDKSFNSNPPLWRGCQSVFCPALRGPGDHRRRCNTNMRNCNECRVFVCEECVSGLEKSCPCQGCRLPESEIDPSTGLTAAFFCPNCRWKRMVNGSCKRTPPYLVKNGKGKKKDTGSSSDSGSPDNSGTRDGKDGKDKKRRRRKAVEQGLEYEGLRETAGTVTDEAGAAGIAAGLAASTAVGTALGAAHEAEDEADGQIEPEGADGDNAEAQGEGEGGVVSEATSVRQTTGPIEVDPEDVEHEDATESLVAMAAGMSLASPRTVTNLVAETEGGAEPGGAAATFADAMSDIELNEFFSSLNVIAPDRPNMQDRIEIRRLQDMGLMARDLIRRIQILRTQAGQGSLVARALPDIREAYDIAAVAAAALGHAVGPIPEDELEGGGEERQQQQQQGGEHGQAQEAEEDDDEQENFDHDHDHDHDDRSDED